MKKKLLLVVALFVATTMSAQFYIGAKVGYGLGTQQTAAGQTVTDDATSNNWVSLGQGFTPGLKLGYFFNDNFGFELGINYFLGAEKTVADYNYKKDIGGGMMADVVALGTAQSSQLRLLPALVYRFDNGFYGRFGMIIPVSGKTIVKTTSEITVAAFPAANSKGEEEQEYHGKFAMGFAGAIGYNFALSDNMNLFGELEYVALSIRSNTAEITKSTTNGTDNLANADVYDYKIEYVDELTKSSNNSNYNANYDKTKAKEDLRTSNGYSSLRFSVGITMSF
jgi:opacity protein-like surface antigen